jgi:hypothetical protein
MTMHALSYQSTGRLGREFESECGAVESVIAQRDELVSFQFTFKSHEKRRKRSQSGHGHFLNCTPKWLGPVDV